MVCACGDASCAVSALFRGISAAVDLVRRLDGGETSHVSANSLAQLRQSAIYADFHEEFFSFVRGFAGAFIFAMPLLYTLEMWTIAITADLWKLTALLLIALALNIVVNYYSGFKDKPDWRGALEQSVEAMAIGIIGAAVVLLAIGRIGPGDPLSTVAGRIVLQAVPLSIGASVANSVFHRPDEDLQDDEEPPEGSGFFNDVGATVVGSVLLAFGIAPTDESVALASELDYAHLAAIVVLSLLLSYGIVFASGFDRGQGPGPFQKPLTETALSYLISLLVAAGMLYLLDLIHSGTPTHLALAMIIVLGLPATVGGAAGRLVI
jgi:putative integral membrane protein (TIGR02587 family)